MNQMLKAYDALAPLYKDYSSKREKYLNAVDKLVIEHLKPDMRLLDIGAGDGRRLAKILDATNISDVIAVEPSQEMARLCRERTGKDVHEALGENLDQLDIGKFDTAIALWNVFGHIPTPESRLKTLCNIRDKLKPESPFILDVNNRHNALAYGTLEVFKRAVIDSVAFDVTRGDASYNWQIGDRVFRGSGHLFVPAEIEALFEKAGFRIEKRFSLNYVTGKVSKSKYKGQLFYLLKPSQK